MWETLISQLERDFAKYRREESKLEALAEKMKSRSLRASLLLKGRTMDGTALSNAWMSYSLFERDVLDGGDEAFFDIAVPANARKASNFLNNAKPDLPATEMPPEVENALQQMAWLKKMKYIAASGSSAQRVIVKLFASINKLAADAVKDMKTRVAEIRRGTFDAWNPSGLLGASSDAAKKVEGAKPTG